MEAEKDASAPFESEPMVQRIGLLLFSQEGEVVVAHELPERAARGEGVEDLVHPGPGLADLGKLELLQVLDVAAQDECVSPLEIPARENGRRKLAVGSQIVSLSAVAHVEIA